MSAAKHTPTAGPLEVSGAFENQIQIGEATGKRRHLGTAAIHGSVLQHEARANATLWAAAPDLLAACEAQQRALNGCASYVLGAGGLTPDALAAAIAIGHAAITKATGGAK